MIEVRALKMVYQMGDEQVAALAGVDLSIARGEHVAVIGPSGSGKSSLMQASVIPLLMERHGFECTIHETSEEINSKLNKPKNLQCRRVRPQNNYAHQGFVLDEIFVDMSVEADRIQSVTVRRMNTCM